MRTRRPRTLSAALTAAAVLLPLAVSTAGPAAAAPAEPVPLPVPESALVPGHPLPPKRSYQVGTPDQGVFPPSAGERGGGDRAARPHRATPGGEYAAPMSRIEYVPRGEEVTDRAARPGDEPEPKRKPEPEPACSTSTGPYQREVEEYLGLEPDGRQSPADCAAIRTFQEDAGIYPDSGFAGPVTWKVLTLRWARANPDRLDGCPRTGGRIACIDLNRQLMWVKDGDEMVYPPVPIRSGKPGLETRTGRFGVFRRIKDEWSRLYDAPMPFAQYFSGGQAVHGVYDDLYTTSGSHGCVNLAYQDAKRLWGVLGQGDAVHVWGAKPAS